MTRHRYPHSQHYRPHPNRFFSEMNERRPGLTPRNLKLRSRGRQKRPTVHDFMDNVLLSEMYDCTEPDQPAEPLIKSVFPDEELPTSINWIFSLLKTNYTTNTIQYSTTHKRWLFIDAQTVKSDTPKTKEEQFALFMNKLAIGVAEFPNFVDQSRFKIRNLFTGKFSVKPPVHTNLDVERKPDVLGAHLQLLFDILSKLNEGANIDWPNIKIIIELKAKASSAVFRNEVHKDLANKVWAILDQQPNRRFVPTFALLGRIGYFSVWNRAGVVHSEPFDIDENPELFLRVMVGFLFASDTVLGFDPTMYLSAAGKWRIRTKKRDYEFVESLWSSDEIQGRATWCWIVRACDTGELFVMKDCWVISGRSPDEVYFFQKANKAQVAHLPTLDYFEDVELATDKPDTTDSHRGRYPKLTNRVHRRLFFVERGIAVTKFQTKKDLLLAFIHYLECHRDLVEKAGILHRDISINNLLIILNEGGLLIDLDYALEIDENGGAVGGVRGVRTGTPPFIAIDLLLNPNRLHRVRFDLESFFYTFLYICATTPGPNCEELDDKDKPQFIQDWLYAPQDKTLAYIKKGQMGLNIIDWRNEVSGQLKPYWNNLKNCIWRLKKLVLKSTATHEDFLEILNDTYKHLPDDDQNTEGDELIRLGSDANDPIDDEEDEGGDTTASGSGYETPTPRAAPKGRGDSKKRVLPNDDVDIAVVDHSTFPEPRKRSKRLFHSVGESLPLS